MAEDGVIFAQRGAVVKITLNRPEAHNAIDSRLMMTLTEMFEQLQLSDGIRVVVLSGVGPSFCAGADVACMRRMSAGTLEENAADAAGSARMFQALAACPQVVVARVQGAAMGDGAGLVATSDVAIAAQGAVFGFCDARLGLVPSVIAPYVVARIGMGAARALFLTAETFDSDVALRIGLAHRVAPEPELDDVVEKVVADILRCGPRALAATKSLLRGLVAEPQNADRLGVERMARARVSPEGREGLTACREKREPGFAA